MPMAMTPTAGMEAPLFLAMWVAMMVAMMFPTAAPMILTFATVQRGKQARGQAFVPTWVFVLAYLLVWTAFGVAAYGAALVAEALAMRSPWLMDNGPRIGGLLLVLAGLYQLSPLKTACLSKCRTPLSFIMTSWRDGYGGAFRMGLEHGWYCTGCCWLLFLILFPLGVMNIAAMVLLTALIFAEKSLPVGPQVARGAAVALIVYGAMVIAMPGLLPGTEGMPAMEPPGMKGMPGM
jgi:predicted metal-binding membrane protein